MFVALLVALNILTQLTLNRYDAGITTFDSADVSAINDLHGIYLDLDHIAGILEWLLRDHSWQCDQEAQPTSGRDRHYDQGTGPWGHRFRLAQQSSKHHSFSVRYLLTPT